jgi:hypothetical protein
MSGFKTDSFYQDLIFRHISPFFSELFFRLKKIRTNHVTAASFLLIIIASLLILCVEQFHNISYRILVALIVQLSFIIGASRGNLENKAGKVSKASVWLGRFSDRLGEFTIFVCCGIRVWRMNGAPLSLFLGIAAGYNFTFHTLAWALRDGLLMSASNVPLFVTSRPPPGNQSVGETSTPVKKTGTGGVLSKQSTIIKLGVGECYLCLSLFILTNRLDIMLFITFFISALRVIKVNSSIWTRDRINQ